MHANAFCKAFTKKTDPNPAAKTFPVALRHHNICWFQCRKCHTLTFHMERDTDIGRETGIHLYRLTDKYLVTCPNISVICLLVFSNMQASQKNKNKTSTHDAHHCFCRLHNESYDTFQRQWIRVVNHFKCIGIWRGSDVIACNVNNITPTSKSIYICHFCVT